MKNKKLFLFLFLFILFLVFILFLNFKDNFNNVDLELLF